MKVLIDTRLAHRGLGIAEYTGRMLEGLRRQSGIVVTPWGFAPGGKVISLVGHSGLFDVAPKLDPRARQFDVHHFASNIGPVFPGPSSVLTAYDLFARRKSRPRDRVMWTLLRGALHRSTRIVAISSRTRREIVDLFPTLDRKVTVIPAGMRAARSASATSREHILAFGGASDPRKRTEHMVRVYGEYLRRARSPLPLVVLGRAGLTTSLSAELEQLGARVVLDASRAEVDRLTAEAAAVLYPTMAEGFGLPLLEAAESATPIVVDMRADLPAELLGDHCFAVDGEGLEVWAERLDEAAHAGAVEAHLDLPSIEEVGASYLSIYQDVS